MAGEAEQILGAERNALQRPAQASALEILIHFLAPCGCACCGQRQRQRIVARPELFQASREGARQFHGRESRLAFSRAFSSAMVAKKTSSECPPCVRP